MNSSPCLDCICQKKYGFVITSGVRQRLNIAHAKACRSTLLGQKMTPMQKWAYENFDYRGYNSN